MHRRLILIFIIIITSFSSLVYISLWAIDDQKKASIKKFAYVFYITERDYACYASVNADRLINDLSIDQNIDIVFLYTNTDDQIKTILEICAPSKVKLIQVPSAPDGITNRDLYAQSYVRFEAFRLNRYDRLVILDSDGLILKNIDHLFTMPLTGRVVAGALVDYLPYKWLSSVLLVVEPSEQLYQNVKQLVTPENIQKVKLYANGSHYDMDVLNYAFRSGEDVKLIPSNYITLDSAFLDSKAKIIDNVYYVHFTARKPLLNVETRRENNEMRKNAKWIYETFWKGFEKRCALVFEKSVRLALDHLEMMERESKMR